MRMYGEAIIDRLGVNCGLKNERNAFRQVFINTVGALLDSFDIYGSMEAPFLQNAEGVYLDLHGKDLGVPRKYGETDEEYHRRMVYEVLCYLTADYLIEVYRLELYVYLANFNPNGRVLTSNNPYICENGFMAFADDEIKQILETKFILDGGIEWIE